MADTGPTKSMITKYDDLNVRIEVFLSAYRKMVPAEINKINAAVGAQNSGLLKIEIKGKQQIKRCFPFLMAVFKARNCRGAL